MVSGSRLRLALLLGVAALLNAGCITGHLLEVSRIEESVSEYERAYREPERLLLRYRALLEDRSGAPVGFERRAAALRLSDLQSAPALNVDAFPVEELRLEDFPQRGGGQVQLVMADAGETAREVPGAGGDRLQVEIDSTGRHGAFRLLGDDLEGPARFHSGALHRSHHAWWAYPLLPLSAAIDGVLFVPQLLAATPLFLSGE